MPDNLCGGPGQGKGIESGCAWGYLRPMKNFLSIPAILLLASCSALPFGLSAAKRQPAAAIGARPEAKPRNAGMTAPEARSVQRYDTTTAAQKAAALAVIPDTPVHDLGKTIVTLGLVTEPGFWLRAGLVKAAGRGQVKTAAGVSVAVDLIPGTGAAQLSLAAFRALNLPLTGFAEVQVLAE
tara:strand:- start:1328 stop:1873 length:546 start_codon:yes stop_codon:yes gene_type:complete